MGLLTCTPLPRIWEKDSSSDQSQSSATHLHSQSSFGSSLSSQPSLPSVPSLSSPPKSPDPAAAYHRCIATLKGHSSYVFSLSLAGKFLYSGSSDRKIRVWPRVDPPPSPNDFYYSVADRNNIVATGQGAVKSLTVLGDRLFTAHQEHKIRVWKIDNDGGGGDRSRYKCVATLPTVRDRIQRLLSAENYVEVRRHKKRTWVHHVDAVSALAVSTDGSDLLYSVSWDRSLKVWRAGSNFKCLESVPSAHDDAINAVALSSDGFVYTGSADKKIKVWKKGPGEKTHSLVATLEKHKSAVNALALSADGSILYSGACDRSIVVWERVRGGAAADHMAVAGALRGHEKAILCLAVVSDLLFSGSADKTVRIWRRGIEGRSYCCLAVLEGHRGPVKCLAAAAVDGGRNSNDSEDSYVVYSGSLDCDIKVWQICAKSP